MQKPVDYGVALLISSVVPSLQRILGARYSLQVLLWTDTSKGPGSIKRYVSQLVSFNGWRTVFEILASAGRSAVTIP